MITVTPAMLNLKLTPKSEEDFLWCLCANAVGSKISAGAGKAGADKNLKAFYSFLQKIGYIKDAEKNIVLYNATACGKSFRSASLKGFLLYAVVILSLTKGKSKISEIKKIPLEQREKMFRLIGCLKKMGADILTDKDRLIISGKQILNAAKVSIGGEKEIFTALLLAALRCEGNLSIKGIYGAEEVFPLTSSEVYNRLNIQNTHNMKHKKNIVLIGMSGAGKTTVASLLSEKLGMPFFDSDEEFEKEEGRKITDVFSKNGEEYFRRRETEVLKRLSAKLGIIISTGGGVVTKKENIDLLRENGIVVYLERNIETIVSSVSSEERPLFKKGKNSVKELFKSREAMYLSSADFKADNNSLPEAAVSEIERFYKETEEFYKED